MHRSRHLHGAKQFQRFIIPVADGGILAVDYTAPPKCPAEYVHCEHTIVRSVLTNATTESGFNAVPRSFSSSRALAARATRVTCAPSPPHVPSAVGVALSSRTAAAAHCPLRYADTDQSSAYLRTPVRETLRSWRHRRLEAVPQSCSQVMCVHSTSPMEADLALIVARRPVGADTRLRLLARWQSTRCAAFSFMRVRVCTADR